MQTEKFKASTQYGDWLGTASADSADQDEFGSWLEANGHKYDGELLVGLELVVGENHGEHRDPVWVHALYAQKGDFDNVKAMIESARGPVVVRRVTVKMPLLEFVARFKRLAISISRHDLLSGREYTFPDY